MLHGTGKTLRAGLALLAASAACAGADYEFRPLGPGSAYRGSPLYLQVTATFPAGTSGNVTVESVTLGAAAMPFKAMCGYLPCNNDAQGRPILWGGGSAVLEIAIPAAQAPGPYTLTVRSSSGGTVRLAQTAMNIAAAPVPLPAPTRALPPPIPNLAAWQTTMVDLAWKWCPSGAALDFNNEQQVWYYDGARTYFEIADYTGDRRWEACALQVASAYRDYVRSLNGNVPGWRIFSRGLRLAWERTGDSSYRQALADLSRSAAFANVAGSVEDQYIRETAYVLNAYIEAERAGEPRNPNLQRAAGYLLGHFDRLFVSKTYQYHQSFFDGLGAQALINYYELTGDPRVPPAVRTMLDWIWTSGWNASTNKLVYNPDPWGPRCQAECQVYFTDLINMVAPAFAWYWKETGDPVYQQRGDVLFAHALDTDISYSGKIFNQNYHWSIAYARWRSAPAVQAGCTYTATPATVTPGGSAGTVTINVSTGASCPWSAGAASAWTVPASGLRTGPGTITIAVDANPEPKERSTAVAIGGAAVRITQGSAAGSPVQLPVFGTGQSDSRSSIADGATDPHYRIVSGPAGAQAAYAALSGQFPFGVWRANSAQAKWISPAANQSSGSPAGTYVYRTEFDLTGYEPGTAVLVASAITADDSVTVRLNGSVVFAGSIQTNTTRQFTVTDGFAAGRNVLEFAIVNHYSGPTGLQVALTGYATPSGSTAAPVTVAVTPGSATLPAGGTVQFTAAVQGTTNTAVDWSVTPALGTVSGTGLYTAPATVTATSTVTVRATSRYDATKSAAAVVTLQPSTTPAPPPPTATRAAFAVFGTGLGADGQPLADAAEDPHYRVVNSNGSARVVYSDRFPIGPWLANSARAKWIAPAAAQGSGSPGGVYTYRTSFDLTGFDASTAMLTGRIAVDDSVRVVLNGVQVAAPAASYATPVAFAVTSGFTAGLNTLDLIVTNSGTWSSPTGVQLELSGTAVRTGTTAATLEVTPATATVQPGGSVQFTARLGGAATTAVNWSVTPQTGTILASGLYTAPATATAGQTVAVTATSQADPSKSATAVITFGAAAGARQAIAVYGTGIAAGGASVLADTAADPHYRIVSSPEWTVTDTAAYAIYSDRFPIGPWLANSARAKWIAPAASQGSGSSGGVYVYRTTFDLTGFDLGSISLAGNFAADDTAQIRLNGVAVTAPAPVYSAATPFTITTGFRTGVNTLEFVVTNSGSWASPTGLRVELSGSGVRQ